MNLEPFKYFTALHSHSKSDLTFNKSSKNVLKTYFERTQTIPKNKKLGNFTHTHSSSKPSLGEFFPFLEERDAIGNILSKPKTVRNNNAPISLARVKLTKDSFLPSNNKVLVMKNQFLFFDKGKKQISKNMNSLLGELINDKTDSENLACSTILRKNSVPENRQPQFLHLVPNSLISMNESQILTEKAKIKELLKYHISPRETNFHFKKQSVNKNGLMHPQEHKQLVDPLKFKKLIQNVSLLGQYDTNFDSVLKKTPSCQITKTERMRNSNNSKENGTLKPLSLLPKRKWSKDSYDDRKEFAKIMKEIQIKVDSLNEITDKNLGIPEHLSWKYEKSTQFLSKFKRNMEDGFQEAKGRIGFLKSILTDFKT